MIKKQYLGLLAAAALAAAFTACDTGSGEEADSWSAASFNQLNGTWKGEHSKTEPLSELLTDETLAAMGMQGMTVEQVKPQIEGINITMDIATTMTIKTDAPATQSGSTKITMTLSGDNKEKLTVIWGMMLANLGPMLQMPGVNIDYDKHSVTMPSENDERPIDADDQASLVKDMQINQHGTKIKVPFNMNIFGNSDAMSEEEFILTKQ